MARRYTWERLAGLTLARQFPRVRGRGVAAVVRAAERIGPIQSQAARAPFLGLAARLPGVTLETVSAAYEQHLLVRGSSIRGTVHTSTVPHHRLLEAVARQRLHPHWDRMLGAGRRHDVDRLWAMVEDLARSGWLTPEELRAGLAERVARDGDPATADLLRTGQYARHFGYSHAALVRRPLRGGWHGQGLAGYRLATAVLGPGEAQRRAEVRADPAAALAGLARVHIAAFGPSSREDLAWWAGLTLGAAGEALGRLREECSVRPGPDGRDYWDLLEGRPAARSDVGTRLLPEFDALVLGQEPSARARFAAPDDIRRLWVGGNGLMRPPVLHAGRLIGHWRLEGPVRHRRLQVTVVGSGPVPAESDLGPAVGAVQAALGLEVSDVEVSRSPG